MSPYFLFSTMKMEATDSTKIVVPMYKTIWHHISEEIIAISVRTIDLGDNFTFLPSSVLRCDCMYVRVLYD